MKYVLRRWRHIILPGHGYVVFYSWRYGRKHWTYDLAGRIYVCRCGKRWYH